MGASGDGDAAEAVAAKSGPAGRTASSDSQSAAAVCGMGGDEIERADFAQLPQFVFAKFRGAVYEILDA